MIKQLFLWLNNWLFATGIRVLECISGLGLLGYAFVFMIGGEKMLLSYPIYYKFKELNITVVILTFAVVGGLQMWAMLTQPSNRRQVLGGFVLIISSLVWGLVFGAYYSVTPPINTGLVFSGILSLLCVIGGNNLIKHQQDEKNE